MKNKKLRAALALTTGLFAATLASVAAADSLPTARTGAFSCGGNYAVTGAGVKKQAAFWTLRNRNDAAALTVTGFRIYDARGTLIYDATVNGLPSSTNNVLGPVNAVLGAHQTATFSTDSLLDQGALTPLPGSHRPIELVVDWSASDKALPMTGGLTRVTRSGVTGEEISRAGFACVETRRGNDD